MLNFARIVKDSPFTKQLQHERANAINWLVNGALKDFADYRYCQGQIAGLQKALDILEDIYKQYESSEDI